LAKSKPGFEIHPLAGFSNYSYLSLKLLTPKP